MLTMLKIPLVAAVAGLAIIVFIEHVVVPFRNAGASTDGILFIECIILTLLFGGLVWDKVQVIRRGLRLKRPKHEELFTVIEIAKVFACLATSMIIFVAVVKVLDLKAAAGPHDEAAHAHGTG
jgi:hypothetical protein